MLKLDTCIIDNGGFRLSADFSIEPGRRVAVIGPSGCGKTTLLEAIAGFLPLLSGRITWQGKNITHAPPDQRPIAMLFQEENLFPHLSTWQNIALGLDPNLRLTDAQKETIAKALNRVGLTEYQTRKPAALSGGQRARVALARVLVRDRGLLLLDEPFAALGPALRAEMLDLVKALSKESGATVLMVSHDPSDARRIAQDVIFVDAGRAHPPAETDQLFANPPTALRDYLGTGN
jgi:thiamine transport system ATP-binding protein